MASEITVKLERRRGNKEYIFFDIHGQDRDLDVDSICIERKAPRKHRDKACWSVYTYYRAKPIGYWLDRLSGIGFDISEFEQACIELGWEKEVKEWHDWKERNRLVGLED